MTKTAALVLALVALPICSPTARATGMAPTPASADRLTTSFFTAGFLADVVARIDAARIDTARIDGGYLQEKTGLIWTRRDNGTDLDWYAADDYCRDLELADWMDWRMPTIDELESLHDRRSGSKYKVPPAISLSGCCPWSGSRSSEASAWNFSFRFRKRFSGSLNYSYELRALCVRGATEADVLFYEQAAEERKKSSRSVR
jgi:hypothetical protein